MRVAVPSPLTDAAWRFRARAIGEDAMELKWPDKDLLQSLLYGFRDYVEGTPTVCTASLHQKAASLGPGFEPVRR